MKQKIILAASAVGITMLGLILAIALASCGGAPATPTHCIIGYPPTTPTDGALVCCLGQNLTATQASDGGWYCNL